MTASSRDDLFRRQLAHRARSRRRGALKVAAVVAALTGAAAASVVTVLQVTGTTSGGTVLPARAAGPAPTEFVVHAGGERRTTASAPSPTGPAATTAEARDLDVLHIVASTTAAVAPGHIDHTLATVVIDDGGALPAPFAAFAAAPGDADTLASGAFAPATGTGIAMARRSADAAGPRATPSAGRPVAAQYSREPGDTVATSPWTSPSRGAPAGPAPDVIAMVPSTASPAAQSPSTTPPAAQSPSQASPTFGPTVPADAGAPASPAAPTTPASAPPSASTMPTTAAAGTPPAATGDAGPAPGAPATRSPLIIADGPVEGFGPIADPVTVVPGGILAPGASPGRLTLEDDFTLFGGTLEIDIWGLSPGDEYDVLDVAGKAIFDSGVIDFVFTNDETGTVFTPAVGDTFTFLTAAGGIEGFDANPDLFLVSLDLASSLDFIVANDGNALTLQIIGAGANQAASASQTAGVSFSSPASAIDAFAGGPLFQVAQVSAPGTLALHSAGALLMLGGIALRRGRRGAGRNGQA